MISGVSIAYSRQEKGVARQVSGVEKSSCDSISKAKRKDHLGNTRTGQRGSTHFQVRVSSPNHGHGHEHEHKAEHWEKLE